MQYGPRQTTTNAPLNGMMHPGNISLDNRPLVKLPSGETGTIKSIGINADGQEILIPTIYDGGYHNNQEAIDRFYKTGLNLGRFANPEASTKGGEFLSQLQGYNYGLGGAMTKEEKRLQRDAKRKAKGDLTNPFLADGPGYQGIGDTLAEGYGRVISDPIRDLIKGAQIRYKEATLDQVIGDTLNTILSDVTGAVSLGLGLVPDQLQNSKALRDYSDAAGGMVSPDSLTKDVVEYGGNVIGGLGAGTLGKKVAKKYLPKLTGGTRNGKSLYRKLVKDVSPSKAVRVAETKRIAKNAANTLGAGTGLGYLEASNTVEDASKDYINQLVEENYTKMNAGR